jgi:hypothetical protein
MLLGMPPDPNVLQIRIGALVSLVIVRDRDAQEYKIVIAEHGLCDRRVGVPLPEDQAVRVAKFLSVSLRPGSGGEPRRLGGVVEVGIEDDPTTPER